MDSGLVIVARPHLPRAGDEEDAARRKAAVCPVHYAGWRCSRTLGHVGDHVEVRRGAVVARWPAGARAHPVLG